MPPGHVSKITGENNVNGVQERETMRERGGSVLVVVYLALGRAKRSSKK
jgi:hypothetical protein